MARNVTVWVCEGGRLDVVCVKRARGGERYDFRREFGALDFGTSNGKSEGEDTKSGTAAVKARIKDQGSRMDAMFEMRRGRTRHEEFEEVFTKHCQWEHPHPYGVSDDLRLYDPSFPPESLRKKKTIDKPTRPIPIPTTTLIRPEYSGWGICSTGYSVFNMAIRSPRITHRHYNTHSVRTNVRIGNDENPVGALGEARGFRASEDYTNHAQSPKPPDSPPKTKKTQARGAIRYATQKGRTKTDEKSQAEDCDKSLSEAQKGRTKRPRSDAACTHGYTIP
ncbi:uncharacterized protein STEHIDRAFT_108290 [Stereum hirsutum FP-91666 SS1]|uniref:uncharacterized protein n=1 Tax=Stereum hirsutum (strain FP-91666) TaxID=721885 RepID=UPI000440CB0B|nr:uncharacterized protein STEHIDRAFT_108290 [Stereum hirsutum FP-91666 SS1]EIM89582.1 hypothetical protein STEHIDRAFT_108290 [Stereum hirsutum FP-91666 SS1]